MAGEDLRCAIHSLRQISIDLGKLQQISQAFECAPFTPMVVQSSTPRLCKTSGHTHIALNTVTVFMQHFVSLFHDIFLEILYIGGQEFNTKFLSPGVNCDGNSMITADDTVAYLDDMMKSAIGIMVDASQRLDFHMRKIGTAATQTWYDDRVLRCLHVPTRDTPITLSSPLCDRSASRLDDGNKRCGEIVENPSDVMVYPATPYLDDSPRSDPLWGSQSTGAISIDHDVNTQATSIPTRRGKGQHTCPRGFLCDKGGIEDDGLKLRIFERNSEFRSHMAKHDRGFKCNVPGCVHKKGFARIDQLERHQRSKKHQVLMPNVISCVRNGVEMQSGPEQATAEAGQINTLLVPEEPLANWVADLLGAESGNFWELP